MKFIRWFVGNILLALNACCRPKAMDRAPSDQERVNDMTQHLSLYQFEACPFCIKVRRAIARLNLDIAVHDINRSKQHEEELIQGGGRRKVPCLRIAQPEDSVQWMYESSEIIAYLEQEFRAAT
ncbi:MAG: glutathione S-transferase N-terminal domain-containing protein [Verrucomicrobia bacterium]|nr:glutathione S-transferase N-terminal domain-containing protein [Verrucomicrobiota bacterium]MDA1087320.1 glutathione S-transferase N-terminal domain-containing protein [Verrucomicrobiota bacterium]